MSTGPRHTQCKLSLNTHTHTLSLSHFLTFSLSLLSLSCLLWNSTLKSWDNSVCKAITVCETYPHTVEYKHVIFDSQSGILPVRNDYVECECYRLGEFAVVNDVERGFGWTLSAGLVAAFIVVSHIILKCQVVVKRLYIY